MNARHSGRWRVRCRVIKKDGEQCKNWANRGSIVCRVPQHGASLPSVRRAAARRFELLADASFEEFRYCLLPANERAARMRAARNILKMLDIRAALRDTSDDADNATRVDAMIDALKKGKGKGNDA